jgi:hypothetical protein
VAMSATVYVGLAATSRSEWTPAIDILDSFSVAVLPAINHPPAVALVAPASPAAVPLGTVVTMDAAAADPEGRLTAVDFYVAGTLIARATVPPYGAVWPASIAGTYVLTAIAYDADGASSTSNAVAVIVEPPVADEPPVVVTPPLNQPPTVGLGISGLISLSAPAATTLTATAADPEHQLDRVEFFAGTMLIGVDTAAPYSISWTDIPSGVYSVTAVAYDAGGLTATSSSLTIAVTVPVGLPPPQAVVFTASSDHFTHVTAYVLEIFAAGTIPGASAPVATSDLGKPSPSGEGEIAVDRTAFFLALPQGQYVATVTAVGPDGGTRSPGVSFIR